MPACHRQVGRDVFTAYSVLDRDCHAELVEAKYCSSPLDKARPKPAE